MALALDGSTPAAVNNAAAAATCVTASFTAPSNSLLVACVVCDTVNNSVSPTCTMSSTISGLGSWTSAASSIGPVTGQGGGAFIRWALLTTSASGTVTATLASHGNADNNAGRYHMKVWVITGHNLTTPNGTAVSNLTSTTNNLTTTAYTSTAANTFGFVCASDWASLGTPASSDLTSPDLGDSTYVSWVNGYKSVASNGASVTFNLDAPAGTPNWNYCSLEIVPAAGASGPAGEKTFHGTAKASIKTHGATAIASVKSFNGVV